MGLHAARGLGWGHRQASVSGRQAMSVDSAPTLKTSPAPECRPETEEAQGGEAHSWVQVCLTPEKIPARSPRLGTSRHPGLWRGHRWPLPKGEELKQKSKRSSRQTLFFFTEAQTKNAISSSLDWFWGGPTTE